MQVAISREMRFSPNPLKNQKRSLAPKPLGFPVHQTNIND
jgi:hypothetical protein